MEQSKKISRKVISIVLSLLMVFSCFSGMSLTAYASGAKETWESDITVSESRTIDGYVLITNDITLTINKGVTLTVKDSLESEGATITVKGEGTLDVTGSEGYLAINGNLVVDGATVNARGGSGKNGTNNNPPAGVYEGTSGHIGAEGIKGNVTVKSGCLNVSGGNGGNGGSSETVKTSGGNGGNAVSGNVTIEGGTFNAAGGKGGNGGEAVMGGFGSNGSNGKAISGTITLGDGVTMQVSTNNNTWSAYDGSTRTQYMKSTYAPHTHDDITFTAWTSTNSLPAEAGNYYLTNDVKLDNTWYAPNGAINLCLDGHNITAAEGKEIQLMDVENGATLNLYDKEDNSGSVSGAVSVNGAILVNSGTFNMYGGTIKDNMTTDHGAGVRVKYGGTFNLYGGSIENNKTKNPGCNGGGVHVETNSTFNMSGGSIKNNTAFSSGGVFIGKNCTFNMSGGSITGNIATNGYGGVVFTDDGTATFKLSGDVTISDNITKIDIDEIDVHETHPSNIVMPDSMTIEVVDALTGEGKIYVQIGTSRVFTNSTGSVKAKDYIDKFVSDSPIYRIKTEGDELKIEAPYLRVGGTYVYDDNAADVFKDGKVKFTPANETTTYATLTLNGYQYDGTGDDDSDGIIYLDTAQLRIVLKGENVVKATNPGIMINRQLDTIISSENGGSLEVVSEQGDAIYANGALTVESGTISATGANRGISANGINLNGGKIVAAGTGERGYGIYCENLPWITPATSVSINSGISSLIASGTLGAVYGNVANTIEGLGWSNTTGTDGQETIAVAAEARSLGYKKVAFVSHTHNFTYSVNAAGDTITATCGNADGECTLTDYKATLKIAAPEELTYDKNAKAAVITDANDIQGTAKVQYQTKSGSTYGEATETAPTNAGTYKASITLGEGTNAKTASVEYTIAKADPTYTAPTGLTATYGDKLADVTLPDGWAWADDTTSVGDVGKKAFKANFTPADTANYNTVNNVDVTVKVNKAANPATVAETAEVVKGGNTVDLSKNVTLNGATGTVTYEIAGEANGCTLDGSVLTSGSGTTTVTVNVNVAADDNYNALETKQITVTVANKLNQNITAESVTVAYGDAGKKVSATTDGDGAISYRVVDGENVVDVDKTTGVITIKKVGRALVIVTAAETATYNEETAKLLVTVTKGDAKITAENVTATLGDVNKSVSATANSDGAISYAVKEGSEEYIDVNAETGALTLKKAGKATVVVSVEETENYNAATKEITVTVNAPAPAKAEPDFLEGVKAKATSKKVTFSWGKVKGAERYIIYATYCGKGNKYKKYKTVKSNVTSIDIKKLNGKKVNPKKNIKVYVVAQKKVNGKYKTIFKSPTFHIAGAKTKYSNVKKITVKKSSYTLNKGKTAKISAKLVLEKKNKKAIDHAAKFRYKSTNKKVAKVDKNGKITAIGKGTATVFVYSNNGTAKAIKITVK